MKQQRRWWGVPAWSVVTVALVLVQVGLDAGLDVGRIPGGTGTLVAIWTLAALTVLVTLVGMWQARRLRRRARVAAELRTLWRGRR